MAQPDTGRRLALQAIRAVRRERRPLFEIEAGADWAAAAPEERARAGRLARATLRLSARAEAALRPFLKRPPPPEIRDLLQLATVELLAEGAAPHGVVDAAVTLARTERPRTAGLVNAVLRRVAEAGPDAWARTQPKRLPGWLRGRLSGAYGNARTALIEALHEQAPPLDLTLKNAADAEAWAGRLGARCLSTGSLRLQPRGAVSALPGFDEGAWWVQDAAAALAAPLTGAGPGQRVLDLCAAPGGKTLQLAAAGAEVTALDISEPRLHRLRDNLARTGLTARIVAEDALIWEPEALFDAVLLDAPCSATGTIRRHPDLPERFDPKALADLTALQARLIDRAFGFLRPGGRLVFCTCSLLPEEGEAQLAAALARHPDLTPEPMDSPFAAGEGALRITPELWRDCGGLDGFFIACVRKSETMA